MGTLLPRSHTDLVAWYVGLSLPKLNVAPTEGWRQQIERLSVLGWSLPLPWTTLAVMSTLHRWASSPWCDTCPLQPPRLQELICS